MREKILLRIKIYLITALMTACSAGGNCILGAAFTTAVFERRFAGWTGLLVSEIVMFFLADTVLFTKYTGILAVMAAFTLITRTIRCGNSCMSAAVRAEGFQQRTAGLTGDERGTDSGSGVARTDVRGRGLYAGMGVTLLEFTNGLFEGLSLQGIGLALWYGIACSILTVLFEKGVTALLAGGVSLQRQRSETMISTACFLAASAWAVIRVGFLPDFIWQAILFLVLLSMGHAYGPAMGAVSGAAVGIVLSFSSGEISYLGILCFLGLLCGMFRELGRLAEVFTFFAGTAGLMFCGVPFLAELRWLAGILTAGALWIFSDLVLTFRRRYLAKTGEAECAGTLPRCEAQTQEVSEKRWEKRGETEVACAVFPGEGEERMAEILKEFAGEVLKRTGNEEIPSFYEMNPEPEVPSGMPETNPMAAGRFWEEKYLETRDTLAVWLAETGEILKYRSSRDQAYAEPGEELSEMLKKQFAGRGVRMHEAWQRQNRYGQTELRFLWSIDGFGKRKAARSVMVKDLIPLMNEAFGMTFEPARENRSLVGKEQAVYEFVRTPNFRILQGSATTKKSDADGNGDTFGVARIGTTQVLFGIADGVGSGRDAADAAAHTLEQLEQLLKSGVTEETSLRLIDSMEVLKDGQGAALDFGVINLNTGICHLLKAGGAPGFLLRGQWVELLDAKTLPLGLLPGSHYERKVKKLYDGDVILLMSDGVFQAFPGADRAGAIGNYLTEIGELGPRDLARCLLDKALSFGKAGDDMSVLAIGVYE